MADNLEIKQEHKLTYSGLAQIKIGVAFNPNDNSIVVTKAYLSDNPYNSLVLNLNLTLEQARDISCWIQKYLLEVE